MWLMWAVGEFKLKKKKLPKQSYICTVKNQSVLAIKLALKPQNTGATEQQTGPAGGTITQLLLLGICILNVEQITCQI